MITLKIDDEQYNAFAEQDEGIRKKFDRRWKELDLDRFFDQRAANYTSKEFQEAMTAFEDEVFGELK